MKDCYVLMFRFVCMSVFSVVTMNCSNLPTAASLSKPLPLIAPRWSDAFSLPALLSDQVVASDSLAINQMLGKPWYASIKVQNAKIKETEKIENCVDYFKNLTPDIRAKSSQEQNAFLELRLACDAGWLLTRAKSSQTSFLPESIVTRRGPEVLPKALALVTSRTEREKLSEDSLVSKWGDVNKISRVEKLSPYQATYYFDGGMQKLSEIGRGDFNSDGAEDVLLLVEDSVSGGSYFNMRLFALTVSEDGVWHDLHYKIGR